ncbi:MAG: L,D-transpeptidase [Hyphomicrobiaceae bacterium]
MRDRSSLSAAALAAFLAVSVCGVAMLPTDAVAQNLIFDWDGEKTTADSGKTHIKFNGGGKPGDIVVSFADRKLYFFTAPGEADVYPVATPRDQSRWEGVTSVSQKRENPSWTPTAHMLSENPKLPRWVPGGHPMNPLGIRALYLGASDYRIHGTDAPWTIGTPVSKGCVRMFNKDVVDLYPRVKVGTKVTVTWQKFDGKTFAITETKGITELPSSAPLPADGKAAKPTLASAAPNESFAAPKPKWRKPGTVAAEDATLPMVEEKPKALADKASADKAAPDDDGVVKKRKWSRAKPVDGDEASDTKVISKTEAKTEGKADVKPDVKAENKGDEAKSEPKADGKSESDAVVEPKRERRVRTASHTKSQVKTDAGVETGSLAKKTDDAAALGVAEKALAAAERAAAAAERAAAAAERAVAASQVKPAVEPETTPAAASAPN